VGAKTGPRYSRGPGGVVVHRWDEKADVSAGNARASIPNDTQSFKTHKFFGCKPRPPNHAHKFPPALLTCSHPTSPTTTPFSAAGPFDHDQNEQTRYRRRGGHVRFQSHNPARSVNTNKMGLTSAQLPPPIHPRRPQGLLRRAECTQREVCQVKGAGRGRP